MKKIQLMILLLLSSLALNAQDTRGTRATGEQSKAKAEQGGAKATEEVHFLLDNWHRAAAKADFKAYFDAIADDGIFIGTDATENWNKKAFEAFAKPYFDRGKAWNFT